MQVVTGLRSMKCGFAGAHTIGNAKPTGWIGQWTLGNGQLALNNAYYVNMVTFPNWTQVGMTSV